MNPDKSSDFKTAAEQSASITTPKKVTGGSIESIRPPGKFAIVVHTEGKKNGEKKYTVKRYQEMREGKLRLKTDGEGTVEAFLDDEKLEYKVMVYDEAERGQGGKSLALEITTVAKRMMKFAKELLEILQDD